MKHVHRIRLHLIPSRNSKQFLDGIIIHIGLEVFGRNRSSIYNHLSIKYTLTIY